MASFPADQCTGKPTTSECLDISAHPHVGAADWDGVGRSSDGLLHAGIPACMHGAGAVGCGVYRSVGDRHRHGADGGRGRLVRHADGDRGWVQRYETRGVALGTNEDDRSRTGYPPLVGDGVGYVVGGARGGRSGCHAAGQQFGGTTGDAHRPAAGHTTIPSTSDQRMMRRSARPSLRPFSKKSLRPMATT